MKGAINFLTFTAISPADGAQKVISVPLSQVREIAETGFTPNIGIPFTSAKGQVTMAGKDGISYWTLESRAVLVDQANGLK